MTTRYITKEVEVEVDMDDFDNEELIDALRSREALVSAPSAPEPANRYIERAYLFARDMPDCPQAFKDLLWHVHGRAI